MMKKTIALSTIIASWTRRLSGLMLLVSCLNFSEKVSAQEAEIVNTAVKDDRVTIRIQVKNEYNQPVTHLIDENFKVYVNNENVFFEPKNWKNPQEARQPPAKIIFLLDMSGSMARPERAGSRQTKLEGAIQAIEEFNKATADRSSETQVAIVPFGKGDSKCRYPVDEKALSTFFSAGSSALQDSLDRLASKTPCAATNIYEPLSRAIQFFSQAEGDPRFYPKKKLKFFWQPQPIPPRLSIILLSDGYHNQPNEEEDFENLLKLLKINDNIVVHTLGYGLKPRELAQKYNLNKPEATRKDVFDTQNGRVRVPPGKVAAEEFVDRDRLDAISRTTGGICQISGNAQSVGNSLRVFLDALLGEYEITYTDPNPIRAERHQVWVGVKGQHLPPEGLQSASVPYRVTSFGWSLPFAARLTMLIVALLVLGIGGAVPFYFWGQYIKREALDD